MLRCECVCVCVFVCEYKCVHVKRMEAKYNRGSARLSHNPISTMEVLYFFFKLSYKSSCPEVVASEHSAIMFVETCTFSLTASFVRLILLNSQ